MNTDKRLLRKAAKYACEAFMARADEYEQAADKYYFEGPGSFVDDCKHKAERYIVAAERCRRIANGEPAFGNYD